MQCRDTSWGSFSRLTLGCEYLGEADWGHYDEAAAKATLFRALDEGITALDVADVYGLGKAEEKLSHWLGPRLKNLILVTKGGVRWELAPGETRAKTRFDLSANYLEQAVAASLKRLGLDCIPLYLLHWPDPHTPLAESILKLEDLKRRGLIQEYGVSNFSLTLLKESLQFGRLKALECPLSLIQPEAKKEILPWCESQGVGVLAYGTLAQGLLSGKYNADSKFQENDRRHRLKHFQGAELEKNLKIIKNLEAHARHLGVSLPQAAIRWAAEQGGVLSAVVGAKTPEQISMTCQAFQFHWEDAPILGL